ncbi:CBS domain-containing protein [Burkholderiaceae bacterium FT117]|uniref:CBS domain-containing protein n=1 Tax=Zeimonas sediminis TaxID=2944268 RepID=UPI002342FEDD|nr:CBS domain-containing protein [Zeimonas sediminis]MCM5569271.1 CBS domain-containing protein [Zeimonas sediminis]
MRARSSTVADYCVREVVTVDRDMPIVDCAKLMHDAHVGSLVVIEMKNGRKVPVGMLTDRDIAIEVVAFETAPDALTAGDIMSGDPATATETEDLLAVLATMRERGVRRLPVVGADGALCGIVSADNLWEVLAEEVDGLVRVIKAEQTRERATRGANAG